jgi:hypothetical protein
VDFDVTDQRILRFSTSVTYWRKNRNGTVHQLFINFRKPYVSVTREVLCNILLSTDYPGN